MRTPRRPKYAGDSHRLVVPARGMLPLNPLCNTAATNAGRREADMLARRRQGETVLSIATDMALTPDQVMYVLDRANARELERRRRHRQAQAEYSARKNGPVR
jgi:hypothetical protein